MKAVKLNDAVAFGFCVSMWAPLRSSLLGADYNHAPGEYVIEEFWQVDGHIRICRCEDGGSSDIDARMLLTVIDVPISRWTTQTKISRRM